MVCDMDDYDSLHEKLLGLGKRSLRKSYYPELQKRIEELEKAQNELKEYKDHLEELVGERTNELRAANDKLQQEIAERNRAEEALKRNRDRLERINHELLQLGPDHDANINRLTALCGEMLGATCALYNRLQGGLLCAKGQWQTPPDFKAADTPEGHICYDLIQDNREDPVLITDLSRTSYRDSDPNVRAYGLETYFGHVVRCEGRPVGSLCVVYVTDYRPSDGDRQVLGIIAGAIGNEDTRKQAEAALRESQQRLMDIINFLPDATLVISNEGRVIAWNRAMEELTGIRAAEMLGKDNYEYALPFYGERRPILIDLVLAPQEAFEAKYAGLERKDTVLAGEAYLPSLNGREAYVFVTASVLRDSSGKTVGAIESIRDVTERRRVEQALALAEAKYRGIFENAVDGIFQTTLEGRFISCNPALARILGYDSPEDLIDTILDLSQQLYVNPEHRSELLRLIREQGSVQRFEGQFFRKDKSIAWISLNVRGVCESSGELAYIEGIAQDVTERKALEARLVQAQKMEAIGTLAGGIAHDFNNILAAILGYTELTKSKVNQPDLNGYLEQTLSACDRAKGLVRQILTFSRATEHKKRPIDVASILREALQLLRATIPSTIHILSRIDPALQTIFADPTQVHQILMNLCANAAHAMREGGGTLEIRLDNVEITPQTQCSNLDLNPGPYVKLSISDTGTGISPDVIHRIFDPFFTTKKPGEGTGLGLSVVYGIARGSGGAVTAQSKLGEGSTFDVYLPAMADAGKPLPEAEKPIPKGSEHILFVDDEEILAAMWCDILSDLGYRVTSTTDSLDALHRFLDNPDSFDLVMTDMTMPGMTGMDLSRKILEVRPDMPILLCTGFNDQASEEKVRAMGIREFAMKPLSLKLTARLIRKALGSTDSET